MSMIIYVKPYWMNLILKQESKISFLDAMIYLLNYCKNHETKQNIVNNYNLKNDNDIQISRTSFYEKEKLISSKCYLDIFNKLYKLHNKYFGLNDEYILIL